MTFKITGNGFQKDSATLAKESELKEMQNLQNKKRMNGKLSKSDEAKLTKLREKHDPTYGMAKGEVKFSQKQLPDIGSILKNYNS